MKILSRSIKSRYSAFDHPFDPYELRANLDRELNQEVVVVTSDEELHDVDGVITLKHRPTYIENVKWVHEIRSGSDDYPLDEYEKAGVVVTNSTGIAGDIVAETVIGYMLSLACGLHTYSDHQQQSQWKRIPCERPFTIKRSSACVIGLGQIGMSVVNRAGALGMNMVGTDIRPVSGLGFDHVCDVKELQKAISDVRYVVLTTPLTPDTRSLIGSEELSVMRDDSYLINVSRSEIVDEDALTEALKSDEIAGAALDVFQDEPLTEEAAFWEMDEVIVTPHIAGQSNEYSELIADLVTTNVTRFEDGDRLWNRVV